MSVSSKWVVTTGDWVAGGWDTGWIRGFGVESEAMLLCWVGEERPQAVVGTGVYHPCAPCPVSYAHTLGRPEQRHSASCLVPLCPSNLGPVPILPLLPLVTMHCAFLR